MISAKIRITICLLKGVLFDLEGVLFLNWRGLELEGVLYLNWRGCFT